MKIKMKLIDSEKRDIIKLIEEGINLPEKYKFLLFDETKKVEINWENKNQDLTNIFLPFQIIEQVDEPRSEKIKEIQQSFEFTSGRQTAGWTNKLIWGDNKYVISSLLYGPMRKEIENEGGVKLIYIDPPFSVGQNYTIQVNIGDKDLYSKKPSIIENFAYRNTWNREGNSFLQMLYERILLMKELLSNDGVLVLRIDYHWGHYVKAILDEIFGFSNFRNEIFINRVKKNTQAGTRQMMLTTGVESLFVYSKSKDFEYFNTKFKLDEKKSGYWKQCDNSQGTRNPPERVINNKTYYPVPGRHFTFGQERMEEMLENGTLRVNKNDKIEYWVGEKDMGQLDTNWTDIPGYSFGTKYPTENSEKLLTRVINACSKEKDLVCDFFNGSGTTAVVCEKLNRKWIASDIGKFSIHVTKKRMIENQRYLKTIGQNWRAFEILNLGKYQRQHYINDGMLERDQNKKILKENKNIAFQKLILDAYQAEKVDGFKTLHGKKKDSFISIGPINHNVTRNQIEEVIEECIKNKIINVDVLGFEYEMGLFPSIQEDAKIKGIKLSYKQIPNEIFNEKAVKSGQVKFFDVAYIEIKPHIKKKKLSIELKDFAVFYDEDNYEIEEKLGNSETKLIIDSGKIIEITKSKEGVIKKKILTDKWYDWVDYWSVDFNFESKPEIIKFLNKKNEVEEVWTGNYIFENEWQSFRSKSNGKLELISSEKEINQSKIKIAVKVVDIFGNDTMKIMDVKL